MRAALLGAAARMMNAAARKVNVRGLLVAPLRPRRELRELSSHGLVDGIPFKARKRIYEINVHDSPNTCGRIKFQTLLEDAARVDEDLAAPRDRHSILVCFQHTLSHFGAMLLQGMFRHNAAPDLANSHGPRFGAMLLLQEHEPRAQHPAAAARESSGLGEGLCGLLKALAR